MKKFNKNLLTLLIALGCWTMTLAQTTLTGNVSDAENKDALVGATIAVKGTINGASTDANGKFSLKVTTLPVTLVVSNVGYETQEVNATKADVGTISLKETASLMSELTVSGNRVEEKITKAPVTVEKITARQLQLAPAFDQYSALQSLKGVDLLTQSLTFKSVNLRGFGANNNNRFVHHQLPALLGGLADDESRHAPAVRGPNARSRERDGEVRRALGPALQVQGHDALSVHLEFRPMTQGVAADGFHVEGGWEDKTQFENSRPRHVDLPVRGQQRAVFTEGEGLLSFHADIGLDGGGADTELERLARVPKRPAHG